MGAELSSVDKWTDAVLGPVIGVGRVSQVSFVVESDGRQSALSWKAMVAENASAGGSNPPGLFDPTRVVRQV
jgi:hypothetical protein